MTIHSPSKLQEPEQKRTKYRLGLPDFGLWWYPRVCWPLLPWKMRGKLAKRVLTVNHSMKDKIARFFGYPENKMGIASHGVDVTTFRPCRATRMRFRHEWGIPWNAVVIVSTSRLSWEKHVDRIVSAFDQIASRNSLAWLVIAGEGPLESEVEKLISDCAASKQIILLGQLKHIASVLQASDLYVLASEFEGSPIALMEAMAVGLVCLVSNIPGPDEMIEDGRDGILIEPSQGGVVAGLKRVLALPVLDRERIATNARSKAEEKFELGKAIQSTFDQLGVVNSRAPDQIQ
jgi:glycosyltransferase involved in cell wall biosynthesis